MPWSSWSTLNEGYIIDNDSMQEVRDNLQFVFDYSIAFNLYSIEFHDPLLISEHRELPTLYINGILLLEAEWRDEEQLQQQILERFIELQFK